MSDTNTFRYRSRRCAAAVSALAVAVVLLVGSPTAALAEDVVATPSPAPSIVAPAPAPSEPVPTPAPAPSEPAPVPAPAPDDPADGMPSPPKVLPRTVQTVARNAVATQSTSLVLHYEFNTGMQPSNPQLSYDGKPGKQGLDLSSNGVHVLRWDYKMTEDGNHTVVVTAALIDTGTLTDYSVKYTSKVNRTGGSIAVRTDCAVLYKGGVIDLDSESPYSCSGGSIQTYSGVAVVLNEAGPNSWADITGTVRVSNADDSAPRISLANGIFGTANQSHRIIMNNREWYPFDAKGVPVQDPKYATISNGESLTWSASTLNSPYKQAEPNTHGQAYFVYEIMLDGVSSGYWLKGFAENYKWTSRRYPSASCEIYAGDPNNAGKQMAGVTPFTCEPTGMTKPTSAAASDTTFVVQMASVDALNGQVEADSRGINEACGRADGSCLITRGKVERITEAPATDLGGSMSLTNNGDHEMDFDYGFTISREVTNNFEQMFGVKTKAKATGGFAGNEVETSIEISSETTFGFEMSNGFEVKQEGSSKVAPWSTGAFYYVEAYDRYAADVYFLGEGNSWYRATGGAFKVPVKQPDQKRDALGPLVPPAAAGVVPGGLSYKCTWNEESADNVFGELVSGWNTGHQIHVEDRTISAYVEKLKGCSVPASWSQLQESAFKGKLGKVKWQVLQEYLAELED